MRDVRLYEDVVWIYHASKLNGGGLQINDGNFTYLRRFSFFLLNAFKLHFGVTRSFLQEINGRHAERDHGSKTPYQAIERDLGCCCGSIDRQHHQHTRIFIEALHRDGASGGEQGAAAVLQQSVHGYDKIARDSSNHDQEETGQQHRIYRQHHGYQQP